MLSDDFGRRRSAKDSGAKSNLGSRIGWLANSISVSDRADKVSPRRLALRVPHTGRRASPPEHFGATAVECDGSDVRLADLLASYGRAHPHCSSLEPLRNLSQKLLVREVAGWTRLPVDSGTQRPVDPTGRLGPRLALEIAFRNVSRKTIPPPRPLSSRR